MLWKKFKNALLPGDKDSPVREPSSVQAMKEAIRDKRKSDPLIGPKLAGRALTQSLMSVLRTNKECTLNRCWARWGRWPAIRVKRACASF